MLHLDVRHRHVPSDSGCCDALVVLRGSCTRGHVRCCSQVRRLRRQGVIWGTRDWLDRFHDSTAHTHKLAQTLLLFC